MVHPRQLLLLLALVFVKAFVIASDSTVVMRPIAYADLFKIAKQEKKPVMLFFHFDGCGACAQMEKTVFTDRKVADFYNSNFVCMDINTRKGEGIETNKIYNVQLHPTFWFLDANGNTLHKLVGLFTPDEFISEGQKALSGINNLTWYAKQYNNGNHNPDFLYDYCYALNRADELDSAMINVYLHTQSYDDLGTEKNIRFIYEFAVHEYHYTMPYNSPAFNYLVSHKDKFSAYFDPEQVDVRILFLLLDATQSDAANDEATFNKIIDMLKEYDTGKMRWFKEIDGRQTGALPDTHLVLSAKLAHYDKTGNTVKYNEALKELITKIWDNQAELNDLAWKYYKAKTDKEDIKKAIGWIKRSIELNNNYYNNDTYAALLYKSGQYEEALKQAEKAIELAKAKDEDYKSTLALVEKIKEKEKNN